MSWTLSNGAGSEVTVPSTTALADILRRANVSLRANQVFCLEHEDGDFMYIGMAGEVGFLNYHPDPGVGPEYVSVRSMDRDDEQRSVWFSFAGSGTEISHRNCLPIGDIIFAACEYCRTRSLPRCVIWERCAGSTPLHNSAEEDMAPED